MKRFSADCEMISPLIEACMDNDIGKAKECFDFGYVNVNEQRDQRGRTPLHVAASRGNVEIMELLCRNGGDLTARDNIGNTLLHMCNHVNVLSFLSERGLSPFERNNNGDTPSMLAERFCASQEVMEFLYKMEQDEIQDEPPKSCPVFRGNRKSSIKDKNYLSGTDDVLSEFGPYKLLVFLLIVACLSLYITYYIIGEMPYNSQILNEVPHHHNKGNEYHSARSTEQVV